MIWERHLIKTTDHDFFKFLDLSTGEDKYSIPSSLHYRLNRKKLRDLLATDLDNEWGKRFTSFQAHKDGVTVLFEDGLKVEGSILLAVDGKNSRIKRSLLGDEKAQLYPLPIAFMGMTLRLSPEKMQPFRDNIPSSGKVQIPSQESIFSSRCSPRHLAMKALAQAMNTTKVNSTSVGMSKRMDHCLGQGRSKL